MIFKTTYPCKACANMASLDLKLFLHYGEYIEQDILEISIGAVGSWNPDGRKRPTIEISRMVLLTH